MKHYEKPIIISDKNKKIIFNKPSSPKEALIIFLEKKFILNENNNGADDDIIFNEFQIAIEEFKKEKDIYENLEIEGLKSYNKKLDSWEENGYYIEKINNKYFKLYLIYFNVILLLFIYYSTKKSTIK